MKKSVSLFCTLTALLLLLASCMNHDPSDTNTTTDPITKESEALSSESVEEPAIKMEIEEGYTVMASANFTIDVTEKGETTPLPARVAILQDANGNHAVYVDVLQNVSVKTSRMWRGDCLLYLVNNNQLILFNCFYNPDQRGNGSLVCQNYQVTDEDFMNGGTKDTVELQLLPSEGSIDHWYCDFSVRGPAQIDSHKVNVLNFFSNYQEVFSQYAERGTVYLLADSYTTPKDAPAVYDSTEKKAIPDFNEPFYTIEYIAERYT